jgi:CheY-like chemotaxis protein
MVKVVVTQQEHDPRSSAAKQEDSATGATARRVLVADDNRDAREALSLFLGGMGYTVATARDGAAALELARTFQPHLVILDVLMPGASGFRTAELLREEPFMQDVVIVTMTGWQQTTDDWLAKHAGADYHLLKPLNTQNLQDILHKHLPA